MLHVPYATKQANSAVCFIAFLFRGRVSVGHSHSTRVWYPPALQRDLPIVCHCMCSKEKATIVKETPTGNSPVPQPHARHCKAAYTALFFDLTPKPSIAQVCPQHESYPALAQPPRPSHYLYACTVHTHARHVSAKGTPYLRSRPRSSRMNDRDAEPYPSRFPLALVSPQPAWACSTCNNHHLPLRVNARVHRVCCDADTVGRTKAARLGRRVVLAACDV